VNRTTPLPTDCLDEIARRIDSHLQGWPGASVPELRRYVGRSPVRRRRATRRNPERYWTLLPQSLLACWTRRSSGRFIRDVLWGQYCLFLFVRLHDDLVDRQAHDGRLIFIADDLLIESRRSFAPHFADRRFDVIFDDLLRTTVRAIVEVDALQSRPGAMTAARVDLYARVSAIFKVGAAAVCLKCGREDRLAPVSRLYDRLAIASQIVDDLFDLEEDLARGRYTAAANIVFDGALRRDGGAAMDSPRVARSVLVDNSLGRLLDLARSHVDRAVADIAPAGVDAARQYAMRFRSEIDRLGAVVHRARVRHLFGDVWSKRPTRGSTGR
jgi:hypothetical protein